MGHIDHRWSAIRRGRGDLPPIVSGLQFFGDLSSPNTSIVSGAVAQLGDSSGNGRHMSQGTSTKRPTYLASDANFGGRPSMQFDGVDDFVVGGAWGGQVGRTIYAVFRQTATASDARIYTDQVGAVAPSAYVFTVAGPTFSAGFVNPVGSQTSKIVAIANNVSNRIGVALDVTNGPAAVPRLFFNGVDSGAYSGSAASNGTSFASSTHAIGSAANGATAFFTGYVTDVLDYSVTHSAAEMALVDEWLRWRNGL